MITEAELINVLENVLQGGSSDGSIDGNTQLMGAMPEFDSMAVVSILTQLEDDYDIVVDDDELDASVFESVQTLMAFLRAHAGDQ